MSIIEDLLNAVRTFNEQLTSGNLIGDIIKDNEAYIVDMNSEQQLYEQGINRLGISIMDYMPYSPKTIEIKEQKGQPTDRVTLRDEGDFHASFYIVTSADRFEIKASDWKTDHLIKKYGQQILGLTDANIQEVRVGYLLPDLLTHAKDILYERK